ncbi:MAG: M15 family metallopeptidase [Dysgonomonas sp.]|nr:M15 family metallopeptidase [Dysgonomonas sp.]
MTKYIVLIILSLLINISLCSQEYPIGVQKLLKSYPDNVHSYDGKYLLLRDNVKLLYDETTEKTEDELLNNPSVSDMFKQPYVKGKHIPSKGEDPGRIRSESLMKAMYGTTAKDVQNNLTTIVWCPKLVGEKIRISKINNIHIQLQKVSEELDRHLELKKYLENATTFNWRIIKGTNRLSTHSFGTAIDLNVKYSNYWQWDCRCTKEDVDLKYKNQIPQLIIDIFEQHGFIWGGKWYHYDTMHFEYRPELL